MELCGICPAWRHCRRGSTQTVLACTGPSARPGSGPARSTVSIQNWSSLRCPPRAMASSYRGSLARMSTWAWIVVTGPGGALAAEKVIQPANMWPCGVISVNTPRPRRARARRSTAAPRRPGHVQQGHVAGADAGQRVVEPAARGPELAEVRLPGPRSPAGARCPGPGPGGRSSATSGRSPGPGRSAAGRPRWSPPGPARSTAGPRSAPSCPRRAAARPPARALHRARGPGGVPLGWPCPGRLVPLGSVMPAPSARGGGDRRLLAVADGDGLVEPGQLEDLAVVRGSGRRRPASAGCGWRAPAG